ncbi:MAG: arginyltransferase [Pirellulaceae bacterium]
MFQPKPLHLNLDNPLVVVHDELQPCPYIQGRDARMPLQWPVGSMTPELIDRCLAQGYRRSGPFLYRTRCPKCQACEPTRIEVSRFRWTRSFRRVLQRGDRDLRMQVSIPKVDETRIALFNKHRNERNLGLSERMVDRQEYTGFLVDTVCDTRELSFWKEEQPVAIATTDFGVESMSLVYCFFDTAFDRYSPGTYSILKHLELATETGRKFVYLGMYVASNSHLRYKARFLPQERLRNEVWETFDA